MDLALSGNKLFSLVSLASKHCWDMWRAGGDCNPSRNGALRQRRQQLLSKPGPLEWRTVVLHN